MTNEDAAAEVRRGHRIRCGACYRKVQPFMVNGAGNDFVIRVRCQCKPGLSYGVSATCVDLEDRRALWAWPEYMAPVRALLDRHGRLDAGAGVISLDERKERRP